MKQYITSRWVGATVLALVMLPGLTAQTSRTILTVASTVPPNGDLNPYGVAVVPVTIGRLVQGHILVSNFNNSANLQGTGTTIVDIAPNGATTVFASISSSALPGPCPGGVGLTTALSVLRLGWVVVGSLPTTDGTAATAQPGCLIVLDHSGTVVATIANGPISGPWDMTALDMGTTADLFVTNVLNGTVAGNGNIVDAGTIVRVNLANLDSSPTIASMTTIGSGFPQKTDPAALVIGPTGLALGLNGTLYIADSLDNRIASIPNAASRTTTAGVGTTVSKSASLNDPLGLTINPNNGNILSVNGNNGLLIVTNNVSGGQIGRRLLDSSGTPPGAGALFGLATTPQGLYFVDDATNTLDLLTAIPQ